MKTFTLQLGQKITKQDLEKADIHVSDYAADLLKKIKFGKNRSVEVVIKTVAELGLDSGASTKDIYAAAQAQGLELCPAEVGPALRLAYTDQPLWDYIVVAAEPIKDSDGYPSLLSAGRDDYGRWLCTYYGSPDSRWNRDHGFAFVVSPSSSKSLEPVKSQSSSDSLSFDLRLKQLEEFKDKVERVLKL